MTALELQHKKRSGDWVIGWLRWCFGRFGDWVSEWLGDLWLRGWFGDLLICWLRGWLCDLVIGWSRGWSGDWVIWWSSNWVFGWLGAIWRLSVFVIEWLNYSMYHRFLFVDHRSHTKIFYISSRKVQKFWNVGRLSRWSVIGDREFLSLEKLFNGGLLGWGARKQERKLLLILILSNIASTWFLPSYEKKKIQYLSTKKNSSKRTNRCFVLPQLIQFPPPQSMPVSRPFFFSS